MSSRDTCRFYRKISTTYKMGHLLIWPILKTLLNDFSHSVHLALLFLQVILDSNDIIFNFIHRNLNYN